MARLTRASISPRPNHPRSAQSDFHTLPRLRLLFGPSLRWHRLLSQRVVDLGYHRTHGLNVPFLRVRPPLGREVFTAEAPSSQRSENSLIKNSLLSVLRASALKTVADPSFGGSAVQSPSPASQESLKTLEKKVGLKPLFGDMKSAG
jgi:hypothetical protein